MTELKILRLGYKEQKIKAAPGDNLYSVLAGAGLITAPCGGRGRCGKCRLKVVSGDVPPLPTEQNFFSQDELDEGWRLACLHQVESFPLELSVPVEEKTAEIKVDGYLPEFELAVTDGYGLMIDIGSTTVAAGLVDMQDGRVIGHASCLNSQAAFGQDVMSRISYADQEERGLEILQDAILGNIRELMGGLLENHGLTADDLRQIVIAGNTTMIHLLAAYDPICLGRAPYKMAFSGPLELKGADLGLVAADCPVYCVPSVSAFIGGDIIAGVLACRLYESTDCALFIDIGTNGEIILANHGKLVGCSCATGPALEGMNISCGSIAKDGAIEDLSIDDGQINYVTIGGADPIGLCGSGLLATVAELYRKGLLDKNGRLKKLSPIEVVDSKRRLPLGGGLVLTQQDVRQVQLAKGAILSGINSLLQAAKVKPEQLDRIIVAGQFGAHLKAMDLLDCGLLPKVDVDKIIYAGNTSLSGAYLCLVGRGEREICTRIASSVDYLELIELPDYQQEFLRCMSFDA